MQLLLQLLVPYLLGLHPFHISICEIEHDRESQSLQITSRLFQDDFELALSDGKGTAFFRQTPMDDAKQVLSKFFKEHLQVTVDSKRMEHRFLGYEVEDNVVWCYLEIEKVNGLKEISVQYSVLVDTFDDQINLAHIRYRGDVKSLKFQKGQLTGTAEFAN
jgi:hypothetical protein